MPEPITGAAIKAALIDTGFAFVDPVKYDALRALLATIPDDAVLFTQESLARALLVVLAIPYPDGPDDADCAACGEPTSMSHLAKFASESAAAILAALPPGWCGHDIDSAWTAVEEVLPDGWVIRSVEREYGTAEWEAWAGVPDPPGDRDYGYGPGEGDGGWGPAYGHGSSPAAALDALRAALAASPTASHDPEPERG